MQISAGIKYGVPGIHSGYRVGDRITVDVSRLGRAFAATESIADDLNRRSVVKYGLP